MYSDLKDRIVALLPNHNKGGMSDDIIKILDEYEQRFKGCIEWSAEDFIILAEQDGIVLNEEEAQEMLEEMIDNHDSDYGITWSTLKYYIDKYTTE